MRLRCAAGLLAAVCLVLVAACSSGSGSGSDVTASAKPSQVSGTVTMWIYPIDPLHEQADWTPRAAAFERAYPHVKVSWVTSAAQEKSYDLSHKYFSPRISTRTLFSPTSLIGQEEKMLPYMTQGSINIASRQIISLLSSKLQSAILNQTPPQQALNAAASAVNTLLSRSSS
jgi:hypothetical protein